MPEVIDQHMDDPTTRRGVLLGRIEMLREVARRFSGLAADLPMPDSQSGHPALLEIAEAQQALIIAFSDWIRVELDEQMTELALVGLASLGARTTRGAPSGRQS